MRETVREYELQVWQDGIEVASVSGQDRDRVFSQAMHYLLVYGQDGPAEVRGKDAQAFFAGLAASPPLKED